MFVLYHFFYVLCRLHAQARVSVVDPLPLVEARIEVAPSCVTRSGDRAEAAPPQKESTSAASIKSKGAPSVALTEATALKGQVLSWCIGIANIGERKPKVASCILVRRCWDTYQPHVSRVLILCVAVSSACRQAASGCCGHRGRPTGQPATGWTAKDINRQYEEC